MTSTTRRWHRAAVALTLGPALVVAGQAGTAGATEGRRTYTGVIDGAAYKVEMPQRWNGTVVLYSHLYYTGEMGEFPIGHSNRPETASSPPRHLSAPTQPPWVGCTGTPYRAAPTPAR
jgi:hypothetical protein